MVATINASITLTHIELFVIIPKNKVSKRVLIFAHNIYGIKCLLVITFLIYKGNNSVTLIDKDIVNAVNINQDKNAVFLFSILRIFFAIFSSFTKEKFLSKANNPQTKNTIHIINTYITLGI